MIGMSGASLHLNHVKQKFGSYLILPTIASPPRIKNFTSMQLVLFSVATTFVDHLAKKLNIFSRELNVNLGRQRFVKASNKYPFM